MFPGDRQVLTETVRGALGDNYVLKGLSIPADKEMRIFALKAIIHTSSVTSGAEVELLAKDGTTQLATVSIEGTDGDVNSATLSETPIKVDSSTAADFVHLQTVLDPAAAAIITIELHYGYVGAS